MSETPASTSATELVHAQRLRWPKWLPYIVAAIAALVLVGVVGERFAEISRFIWPIFIPLLAALAFAYILEPVVLWSERRGLSRRNAILATLLGIVVIVALFIVYVVPSVIAQLTLSAEKLPSVLDQLLRSSEPQLLRLRSLNEALYQRVHGTLDGFAHNPGEAIAPVLAYLGAGEGGVMGLTAKLFDAILVPLFVYYILLDLPKLRTDVESLIPPRFRTNAHEVFDSVAAVGSNFIRGQIIIGSILSVLYVVGFALIGVPLAIALGVVAGFALLIPYVGPIAALALTCALTILDSPEWWRVGAVVGLFFVVQTSEAFILTPYVLGEKLSLHPFLVLAAVTVGGHLFGILGMILATPTVAAVRVFIAYGHHSYLHSKFYTGPVLDFPALLAEPPAPDPEPHDAFAEVSQEIGDDTVSPVDGEAVTS